MSTRGTVCITCELFCGSSQEARSTGSSTGGKAFASNQVGGRGTWRWGLVAMFPWRSPRPWQVPYFQPASSSIFIQSCQILLLNTAPPYTTLIYSDHTISSRTFQSCQKGPPPLICTSRTFSWIQTKHYIHIHYSSQQMLSTYIWADHAKTDLLSCQHLHGWLECSKCQPIQK